MTKGGSIKRTKRIFTRQSFFLGKLVGRDKYSRSKETMKKISILVAVLNIFLSFFFFWVTASEDAIFKSITSTSSIEDQERDTINCEAARYLQENKVHDDRLKRPIETRCNLDHLVANCPNADPQHFFRHYIQICKCACNIGTLRLVDLFSSISDFETYSQECFTLLFSILVQWDPR
ncbi:hypothetical protein K501DRAFT_273523 [Backusella circina FSU 941]|nr:hypothetical protein K501DRAFT_273523 [Backusella circina FSU 941]